jgi:hypothetical protein
VNERTCLTGISVLSACGLLACAEATPVERTDAARQPDAFVATTDAPVPAVDAYVPPGTDAYVAPGTDAYVPPVTGGLILNELVPDGDPDFAELYNPTSSPIAITGMIFADADGITDPPDPTHRTTLPEFSVAPGAYLVIAMNVDPPAGSTETPVGPVSPCPVAGVDQCLQVAYGIGRTGDTLVLFAPDGTTELARAEYMGALMGASQSFCRFPNATGDFTTCTSTPGAPNAL